MKRRPRVLVIDDSAFARTVLSRMLRESGAIDVIGSARDGADALERIDLLDPDVVTLDLTMPVIDGLAVLRTLAGRARPRVVVVSISSVETELGAEALALGAVAIIAKPTALASDRLHEIRDDLVDTIAALVPPESTAKALPPRPAFTTGSSVDLVMIGTSTGGPQALTRLISGLPANLAAPVTVVLHIPAGYTEALARRLDKASPLRVVEAEEGIVLEPGIVVLARGGSHLRVVRSGSQLVTQVSPLPIRSFTPSVDELFLSGATAVGARGLGIVLTGMGDDGLVGSRAIAAAGGSLLTEAAASCVVYGMPRCVDEAHIGAVSVHLDEMVREIAHRV